MSEEDLVDEIVARCRERAERGESIEFDAIERAHPELAERLHARFDVLRMLERAYAAPVEDAGSCAWEPDLAGCELGPYRIRERIGAGGMGSVWRAEVAEHRTGLEPGRTVAVKLIHPHLAATPGFVGRFLREAATGRAVRHPNVVRTYDADVHRQHRFLVMEYVEGQTLRALLKELERIPEQLCRHIGREVASGLAAIHAAGVIHRDIKPENVIITSQHVVKVMDLGVARLVDEAVRLSQAGSFVGSLQYAAPEQFASGGASVDARADLHALGVVLHELACGTHPYAADDVPRIVRRVLHEEPRRLGEVNPQISPFFEEVVRGLLAKDPEKRFASAMELASVLDSGEEHGWWKERALLLQRQTRRPLRRIRVPRETAVHGREAELAALRRLFEKARSGEGQVVLIEGEAGIGKSRIVDELIGRLQQEGEDLEFLFGSFDPGGDATAASAFSRAYRRQFGDAGVGEHLRGHALLAPAFDAFLAGDPVPPGAVPLTKDSLLTCFVDATRALAAGRTTVVAIEDLHFAPEEGRALFTSLARAVPGHRVLLMGTTRPDGDESWQTGVTRLAHASRLQIARLGPRELVHLLEDAFASRSLAATLVGRIALKSDGNPFFVFEIIRGLRESRIIERQADGTWSSTRPIGEIKIPSSVLDLVHARVADLSQEERDLLDVACCWGFEFDPFLVGAVVELERIPTLKRFSQIERRHRLVRSVASRFAFDHHLVQEALYERLPELLREEYHAALAAALERNTGAAVTDPASLPGVVAVGLAEHFLRGARGEAAMRYLAAALTHLETGYLNAAAAALAERALAAEGLVTGSERVRLLLRLVGRLDLLGRRDAEIDACREAEDLARSVGDTELMATAAQLLGRAYLGVADAAAAEQALRRAQELARRIADRQLEGAATGNLGNVLLAVGRFAEARERHESALALACEAKDRRGEAIATGNLGRVCFALGELVPARMQFQRSLDLSAEVGYREGELASAGNLGSVLLSLGCVVEAREHYERCFLVAREIGHRQGEANATGCLGVVHFILGNVDEAATHHARDLALAQEMGDRRGETDAVGNLGAALLEIGRFDESRACYDRKLALALDIGYRAGEAAALAGLGRWYYSLGGLSEARDHWERCLALARAIEDRRAESLALSYLGELHAEEDDAPEAQRCLAEALALHRAMGGRAEEARTLRLSGALLASAGRTDEARDILLDSLRIAREIAWVIEEFQACLELTRLPGGDLSAALAGLAALEGRIGIATAMKAHFYLWPVTNDRTHLAEARRLLDVFIAGAPPEFRAAMRDRIRLHRAIVEAADAA